MSLKIFSNKEISESKRVFELEAEIAETYKQIFLISRAGKSSPYKNTFEERKQEGILVSKNLRERYKASRVKYETFAAELLKKARKMEILRQRYLAKPVVKLLIKKRELENMARNDSPFANVRLMIVNGDYLNIHEQLNRLLNFAEYNCATMDNDYHKLARSYCNVGRIVIEEVIERILDYRMTGKSPVGADEYEILKDGAMKAIRLYDRVKKFSKSIKEMSAKDFVGEAIFPIFTEKYDPEYPQACKYVQAELKKYISSGLKDKSRVQHIAADDKVTGFTRTNVKL